MADLLFRDPRFDALRNALYHTERQNFFDRLNRSLNFLVIVLSAGVVGKIAGHIHLVLLCHKRNRVAGGRGVD